MPDLDGRRRPTPTHYEMTVRGPLGPTVMSAFTQLSARRLGDDTVLMADGFDQAALYGVLRTCESLGLELLEVRSGTVDARA